MVSTNETTVREGRVFSADDFRLLKSLQRELHDLVPLMDASERCGMECEQSRAWAKSLSDTLSALEREFMSPPPQ